MAYRRAAKIDTNQSEIVAALRRIGAVVSITSALGDGFPDIVVGFRKKIFMLEIKDGKKPPSAQALTEKEKKFHTLWQGYNIHIVRSADEAIHIVTNA